MSRQRIFEYLGLSGPHRPSLIVLAIVAALTVASATVLTGLAGAEVGTIAGGAVLGGGLWFAWAPARKRRVHTEPPA
jgi:hypothetical protein